MDGSIIRRCDACGAGNRVPAERLADRGRCGSCKSVLPPLSEPLAVDAADFESIVSRARVPVLVDFWADWCGPCRMAAPEVAAVAHDMAGKALVLKVDTESEPALANRFQIQGIPNFVVLRDGRMVLQRAGVTGRAEMRGWLERAASGATRHASDRV